MRYRTLGKTDIQVSEIGFGLWAAGGDAWGPTDDQDILDAIDYALDHGVNFYDTADVYGWGHSEELLGRAMQGRRERFIVATKIGWRDFDGEAGRSAYTTVAKLIAGVESNLRRLNTDYVDIIQSHINFRDPTMAIFLEGFQRLQKAGKVRAYGVSTGDFEYLRAFNHDGNCATLQIDYSILNRTAEADILPYCQAQNIGVIVRGALAMGILAGKFTPDTRFSRERLAQTLARKRGRIPDLPGRSGQSRTTAPPGPRSQPSTTGVAIRAGPSGGQHRDPRHQEREAGGGQSGNGRAGAPHTRRTGPDRRHRATRRRPQNLARLTIPSNRL
jgi:aryl-alcohol dehydrogenase-like predicted oxidoreductase